MFQSSTPLEVHLDDCPTKCFNTPPGHTDPDTSPLESFFFSSSTFKSQDERAARICIPQGSIPLLKSMSPRGTLSHGHLAIAPKLYPHIIILKVNNSPRYSHSHTLV
jgi:hypothetical protein